MIVTSTSFREKVVLKDDSLFCVVSCSYLCRLFKLYYVVYFSCTLFIFFIIIQVISVETAFKMT